MTITQETPTHRSAGVSLALGGAALRTGSGHGALALLDLLQNFVVEAADRLLLAPPALSERRYQLLELNDEVEIWAIHWPQGEGLELHDHGGSMGALWVVEGSLEEHYVRENTLGRRSIVAGGGAAFGPTYVHDVVNVRPASTTSVHAYSPPMPSMTFYRHDGHALLVDRAEYRSDPSWAP